MPSRSADCLGTTITYDNVLQLEELVAWLREHQDATMTVRGGGSSWEVGFGYNNQFKRLVLVNGFNGQATILTRWN